MEPVRYRVSTSPPSRLEQVRAVPVTALLAVINVAVFLWAESQGDTTEPLTLLRFGAVEPVLVHSGQYWRLASYMFLHIGWTHLIWNTWASVSWCSAVERYVGHARFLAIYLLAGIGGGAASVIFSPAVSAGASGAMFGIVGATLAIRWHQVGSTSAFFADRGVRATLGNIALWTAIGLTAIRMNHFAHFGGLAVGAVATWAISLAPPTMAGRTVARIVLALAFAALVGVAVRPMGIRPEPSPDPIESAPQRH